MSDASPETLALGLADAPSDDRLTLLAQSADDLPPLSALLQDATVRLQDIGLDRRGRRLVLLVNRFRWEDDRPSRVRCALRLETVDVVQRQAWPRDPEAVLDLLSIIEADGWLHLTFAGGPALRARAEVIDVVLEDLAAPWPTARAPQHG